MLRPEHKELLDQMHQSPYGRALKEFFEQERANLDSVFGAKSLDEVLAKQKAIDIIDKLFAFLGERKVVDKTRRPYE